MPELPEVQTVVDDLLRAGLTGSRIVACKVTWPRSLADHSVRGFTDAVCGRRVTDLSRRGKFIVIRLSGGLWLLVHLRMTGRLVVADPSGPPGKHEHVIFELDDGRDLRFYDPRKFGRLRLVEDPAPVLGPLGPEPLGQDFTARLLAERLAGRRRAIKPLLLDQTFLAGLGNIYTDEAL